jgi:hypothetical protein
LGGRASAATAPAGEKKKPIASPAFAGEARRW